MSLLQDDIVTLRCVEPSDLEYMYKWENSSDFWGVSGTLTPFSRHTLNSFIEAQNEDIYSSKQLRLMIESQVDGCVGMVDIFDFDPYNLRAGVGIFITPEQQGKSYAKAALKLVIGYAANHLMLKQLWCSVAADNEASLSLFESVGFIRRGVRPEWIRTSPTTFCDEIMLSRIINQN